MKFLKENWYKLMTGTAMLIFACGFFIYAVSPSYANYTKEETPSKSDYALVPLNKDGSINIKISEEQLNEIKPPASTNCVYLRSDEWVLYYVQAEPNLLGKYPITSPKLIPVFLN